MTEKELLDLWSRARLHLIVSQLAPTFLLTVTITALALADGFGDSVAVKLGAAGILLASGILGFLAQYSAASEAMAIASDLRAISEPSAVSRRIIGMARFALVARFLTPAIFVVIYLAIICALFFSPALG
jgi:hypothetical protein